MGQLWAPERLQPLAVAARTLGSAVLDNPKAWVPQDQLFSGPVLISFSAGTPPPLRVAIFLRWRVALVILAVDVIVALLAPDPLSTPKSAQDRPTLSGMSRLLSSFWSSPVSRGLLVVITVLSAEILRPAPPRRLAREGAASVSAVRTDEKDPLALVTMSS